MNFKILGLLIFFAVLLTACADTTSVGDGDAALATATPEVAAQRQDTSAPSTEDAAQATPIENPTIPTAESAEPSPTPATPTQASLGPDLEPTPTEQAPAEAQPPAVEEQNPGGSCSDPFEGQRPRFRTEYWTKTDFCKHSVSYDEIASGGPPPDGIPPIDNPAFESIKNADAWLASTEPVIALELEGQARAYPLSILILHEIVNDELAEVPLAITFCPLCNAAIVFDRRVDDQVLSFGTSGNLRHSDLVMWDRQTESWWQQFTGEAIVGAYTGTQLSFLPAALVSWADFKSAYPNGDVLSRDTGFDAYFEYYGVNPYTGYDNLAGDPYLFDRRVNMALPPMARVAALVIDDSYVAYPFDVLAEERAINDTFGGQKLVVFWKAGTNSALDGALIRSSRDVGSTGIFDRVVDGQELSFKPDGGFFRDEQTNSKWTLVGEAVEGPLSGKQLTRLIHHEYFWFAWAAFRPTTGVYGEE